MTRLLELLISIVIVVVLFFVVAVFLPSKREVRDNMETNHPVRQVYDTLNGFKRFGDWHPLRQHDPSVKYSLSGPPQGVGAALDFASAEPTVGSGRWEIVESEQDLRIKMSLTDESYGTNKVHEFNLDNKGKTVDIQWDYSVDYGWDLLGRYAGLYVTRTVGDDIKRGLGNLVGLFATMPNFDYTPLTISTTDVPIANILYVSTTADRNITAVDNAMVLALTDINAAIAANKLEAAGAPRLITTNFGADKYEFDIAIPVRMPVAAVEGTDAADAAATDADPATEADTAVAAVEPAPAEPVAAPVPGMPVAPVAPPALTNLRLPANVLSGQSYGGRALVTDYQGHPATLPLVRDMLRSYAAAHGETVTDRAFEEYLTGITDTAADEAKFKVYWPIR
jgi:hypothetical protein